MFRKYTFFYYRNEELGTPTSPAKKQKKTFLKLRNEDNLHSATDFMLGPGAQQSFHHAGSISLEQQQQQLQELQDKLHQGQR